MALTVNLYNFEKRKNSTKQPAQSDVALVMLGEVKQDFSPMAPVITFNLIDPTSVPSYNYAFIADFGNRYYFITHWLYVSGLWRATMAVDVLATYKAAILASRQYIKRSKYFKNAQVDDSSYLTNTTQVYTQRTQQQAAIWGTSWYDGTVVLGIVNNSGWNIGAVTYYAFSYGGFRVFMSMLLSDISWMNISTSEISEELQKALINPTQYIVSCVWLPYNGDEFVLRYTDSSQQQLISTVTNTIRLGWWPFTLTGGWVARILNDPTGGMDTSSQVGGGDWFQRSFSLNISNHPQRTVFGDWCNLAPYRNVILEFAPFGRFELDSYDICTATYISCKTLVHAYDGSATLNVFAGFSDGSERRLFSTNASVGINIPIGQIAVDPGNLESALYAGAAAALPEVLSMFQSGGSGNVATAAGRMGGTTISGSHGGSHHSGTF